MGPLEQALWNALSPPEHKAAVEYFLRVFIIHERSPPMEVFLETLLGNTSRFSDEQGEEEDKAEEQHGVGTHLGCEGHVVPGAGCQQPLGHVGT